MPEIIRIVRDKAAWLAQQTAEQAARQLVKRFDASLDLATKEAKTFRVVKDAAGEIVDYRDVRLKGYLSTFAGTTPADMVGDYVEPGAFTETIKAFMRNPVMLKDHRNSTENIVGRFVTVQEDGKGLYVEGLLSNAPDVQSIRYKVVEESLKTLSMGGIFYYKEDKHGIFKVILYEGSLTPIPANRDAMFQVRALTDQEWHKARYDLAA